MYVRTRIWKAAKIAYCRLKNPRTSKMQKVLCFFPFVSCLNALRNERLGYSYENETRHKFHSFQKYYIIMRHISSPNPDNDDIPFIIYIILFWCIYLTLRLYNRSKYIYDTPGYSIKKHSETDRQTVYIKHFYYIYL